MDFAVELRTWVVAVIYAFTGMVLLFLGYKLFDAFTPTDLQRKVFEEGNVAAAVAVGFFMLGVAVVIHAALKVG
jgi:putative membrane protein